MEGDRWKRDMYICRYIERYMKETCGEKTRESASLDLYFDFTHLDPDVNGPLGHCL